MLNKKLNCRRDFTAVILKLNVINFVTVDNGSLRNSRPYFIL